MTGERCGGVERLTQYQQAGTMALTDEDKQWIREQLERVETRLLTEFQQWASPFEARQRSHSAGFRAIDAEIENLQRWPGSVAGL